MWNIHFHKFEVVEVIETNEQWINHKSGTKFIKTKYDVKYECKYCDKKKFHSIYDEWATSEEKSILAEARFWLKEHKEHNKYIRYPNYIRFFYEDVLEPMAKSHRILFELIF